MSRSAAARILLESALIVLVPLTLCRGLSFIGARDYEFTRIYLPVVVGMTSATLALTSLSRLQWTGREACFVVLLCLATILVATRGRAPAGAQPSAQLLQLGAVLVADCALLLAMSCCGLLLATRAKRQSYLVMTGIATSIADFYSVYFGPTGKLVEEHQELIAPRAMLHWFVIDNDQPAPIMGMGDLLFLALFFFGARRLGFDLWRNVLAQLFVLGIAYAVIVGELLAQNPPKLAGLMFIGPAFIAANWGRFELEAHERRGLACVVGGLTIALVAIVAIQRALGG